MFEIRIETGNAAFAEDVRDEEIARILRGLADELEHGSLFEAARNGYGVFDVNGNRVGQVSAREED